MRRIHVLLVLASPLVVAGCGSGSRSDHAEDASSAEGSGSAGSTTVGTSCQASGKGLTDCGSPRENCCTSLEVPGGTYYRTYTNDGTGAIGLADPATVSAFHLDKYLVTVGRFRRFVAAWSAGYTPAAGSGRHLHLNGGSGLNASAGGYEPGWLPADSVNISPTDTNLTCDASYATWTSSPTTQESLPINCVNWYEAYAFCIWDGGFLPSEAEWEFAAAGGSNQLEYPWGSTDPGTTNRYAIYGDGTACYYPSGAECTGVVNIAPVGTATLGPGPWGQLDLAGEVWEWNIDWFNPDTACVNCANFTAASFRIIRGGEFLYDPSYLVPWYRSGDAPSFRANDVGFRCGRTP